MEILIQKIIFLLIFLIFPFFFCFVPFFIKAKVSPTKSADILSLSNCFAGGVFFGSGLMDLLPDAESVFIAYTPVPVASVLCGIGFFLIFVLEKVFFIKSDVPEMMLPLRQESEDAEKLETEAELKTLNDTSDQASTLMNSPQSPMTLLTQQHKTAHSHHIFQFNTSKWLPFILLIVLSIHSVISGSAVGVVETEESLISIVIAILAHKWTECIALSSSLLKTHMPTKQFLIAVILYAIMEPLGGVIGLTLSIIVQGSAANIIRGILTGIASGTFLYVALVDILLEEFVVSKYKYRKFLLAIFGFALICSILLYFRQTPS